MCAGPPAKNLCLGQFPCFVLFGLLVQPDIALMAAGRDSAFRQGGTYGAALLLYMGAAGEPALAQVRLKLSERVLQVLFPHT